MHSPTMDHQMTIKRILRYLKGTAYHGLLLRPSPHFHVLAYSDADWGGDLDDRKSTTGFSIYIGHNLISWVQRSSER